MEKVVRIRPPRTPRALRSVKLTWVDYAQVRFTAMNIGTSISNIAGAIILRYAPSATPGELRPLTSEAIYLNLKLLPEEAIELDKLALRLEEAVERNVSLSDAFRTCLAQAPFPRPPIGLADDVATWLRVTYSRYKTARPERPYRAGWQSVGPGFLSEQRRAIRAARRARSRVRNLARR